MGSRNSIDCLSAVYWSGAVRCSHAVREISLTGAVIETELNWCAGTLIHMTFRRVEHDQTDKSGPVMGIWARVVRRIANGFCVQFVFVDRKEALDFQQFVETVVEEYKCESQERKAEV